MTNPQNRRYTVDLRQVTTKQELHLALKETFGFPAHYGCNWDAFWDCLGELSPVPTVIELIGFGEAYGRLGYPMTVLLNILHDFRRLRGETVEILFDRAPES